MSQPQEPAPGALFWGLLSLGLLAGCAGYSALVLATASWPEAAALRQFYHHWHPRAYTEAEFLGLRTGLAGLALSLGLVGAGLSVSRAGRREWRALGRELTRLGRGVKASWRALLPRQRRLAGALLLALTALRVYYSIESEPYDDAISFEVFVRARLLGLSACYPMPNNHVFFNTLAWGFYQVYPGFWWSMRLPVLLLSTLGSGLWLLGLLRWGNFRVALGAVVGFGVLLLSLYHAAAGRGYWLLIDLAAVGFFGGLVLTRTLTAAGPAPAGYARVAWLGLVLGGAVGLYTVPTFGYFLFSVYGWLGLAAGRRNAGVGLVPTGLAGGLTLLGAAGLYAPLLLISGPALLLHNEYVTAVGLGEFCRQLPVYLWQTEGWLAGQRLVGAVGTLAGLALFGWLWWRARAGALPAEEGRLVSGLGGAALWFAGLPYALVLAQRVPAPERTLLYKAQFGFVLAAVGADWLWRRPGRRWVRPALVAAGLGFALAEVGLFQRYNAVRRAAWAAPHAGFAWLASRPAGPVLVPGLQQRVLLRFYAHSERVGEAWQFDERPRPRVRYRYLVYVPGAAPLPGFPLTAAPPAFQNAELAIFEVW